MGLVLIQKTRSPSENAQKRKARVLFCREVPVTFPFKPRKKPVIERNIVTWLCKHNRVLKTYFSILYTKSFTAQQFDYTCKNNHNVTYCKNA